jgi:hypothetical protein
MLEFGAHPFYETVSVLHHIRSVIRFWGDNSDTAENSETIIDNETVKFIITQIGKFLPHLEILNAKLTKMSCTRLLDRLAESPCVAKFGDIATSVESINQRLSDELCSTKLFVLKPENQQYYNPLTPLFGSDVDSRFTSVSFELDEAAKCLAFGRPTACVFHLMRIMEIGVGATARCLGIPDPIKPAERNWGHILGEIRGGIHKKWPSTAQRMRDDGALFEELYTSLDAVKNPWRNATMHVERKYTDDEAEHVFVAVKGFMMKLASRCDESGEPKA